MPGGDGEERREDREVPVGAPWRGRNPPHVAKVSSWVWRTPEGPLRASEVAAMEPARLCPCRRSRVPTDECFQLLPARHVQRRLRKRFPLGCPDSCHRVKGGGRGILSTRNGKDSLLCSCRPTKPLPHFKGGRIPETAAPNSVEAGLILPVDL